MAGNKIARKSCDFNVVFTVPDFCWRHHPLRLQNQYTDRETGLHYNFFRYYEPEVGRGESLLVCSKCKQLDRSIRLDLLEERHP